MDHYWRAAGFERYAPIEYIAVYIRPMHSAGPTFGWAKAGICSGSTFPNARRSRAGSPLVLAARGAALLVVPVHGGHRPDTELALHARGTNVLIARAVENSVPLIAADVAGLQGERVSHGTTTIVDSQGTILAAAPELEEGVVVADVDADACPGVASTENFSAAVIRP
jgi:predicted amidohydrolase